LGDANARVVQRLAGHVVVEARARRGDVGVGVTEDAVGSAGGGRAGRRIPIKNRDRRAVRQRDGGVKAHAKLLEAY